jgi:hypothetical protein
LQLVELLGTSETRDELGLGVIRDTFAEALFPGTSTVQRRAAYFLFVPWTFRDVERRSHGRNDALERTRKHELALVEALLRSGDRDGVIGARARQGLRQLPSMIYWQGLQRWGIRRGAGSREQWGRSVSHSSAAVVDDDGQVVPGGISWWHTGLPEAPDDWPAQARLDLRPADAEYLRERIHEGCAGSVLATLARRRDPWQEVPFAWQLDIPELDDGQRRLLMHARRFSEAMHGAALLYNHALAVAHTDEERETGYREGLLRWAEQESVADRASVPLAETWNLLARLGSRHSPATRRFVEEWYSLAADPSGILDGTAAVGRVRSREREVKGRQARLSFDAALQTWRGAAGAGQLEFRWPSAQRQLLDVIGAKEA